jgi:hypothetical protein
MTMDVRNELISMSGYGHHVSVLAWALSESLSESRHVDGQIIFFDYGIGPNPLHQLILFDQTSVCFK